MMQDVENKATGTREAGRLFAVASASTRGSVKEISRESPVVVIGLHYR
jgi:hypothetical protein